MFTEDEFFANGYRWFKDRDSDLYQKRVKDENLNTKYFININRYEFDRVRWEVAALLYITEDQILEYRITESGVKHGLSDLVTLEEEIDRVWQKVDAIHDPHNNWIVAP